MATGRQSGCEYAGPLSVGGDGGTLSWGQVVSPLFQTSPLPTNPLARPSPATPAHLSRPFSHRAHPPSQLPPLPIALTGLFPQRVPRDQGERLGIPPPPPIERHLHFLLDPITLIAARCVPDWLVSFWALRQKGFSIEGVARRQRRLGGRETALDEEKSLLWMSLEAGNVTGGGGGSGSHCVWVHEGLRDVSAKSASSSFPLSHIVLLGKLEVA